MTLFRSRDRCVVVQQAPRVRQRECQRGDALGGGVHHHHGVLLPWDASHTVAITAPQVDDLPAPRLPEAYWGRRTWPPSSPPRRDLSVSAPSRRPAKGRWTA